MIKSVITSVIAPVATPVNASGSTLARTVRAPSAAHRLRIDA
ncbi:hypothetical protein [Paraburkholderia sp. 2C]